MKDSDYGGTMRLGAYAAILDETSKIYKLYKETGRIVDDKKRIEEIKKDKEQSFRLGVLPANKTIVLERHRHRYEVNPEYLGKIEKNGLIFSGYHQQESRDQCFECFYKETFP